MTASVEGEARREGGLGNEGADKILMSAFARFIDQKALQATLPYSR